MRLYEEKMRNFTSTELERMQGTQEEGMMDICDLLEHVETDRKDEYGKPVEQWVARSGLACGLDLRSSGEVRNAEADLWDVRLRLPIDTEVSRVDRVVITHRFGALLGEPMLFQVEGEALRGPSGLVLKLKN